MNSCSGPVNFQHPFESKVNAVLYIYYTDVLSHLLSLLRLAPCPEASIVEEVLSKNSAVDDPVQ